MKNIKLSTKLVGGFMGIAFLTAVVGTVGTLSVHSIDKADTELYEQNTVALAQTGKLKEDFQKMRNVFRDGMMNKFLFSKDTSEQFARVKELDQSMQTSMGTLEKIVVTEDLGQALTGVKTVLNEYYPVRDKLSGLVGEGRQPAPGGRGRLWQEAGGRHHTD
jgi:methyl-accepting chemotaxis protein